MTHHQDAEVLGGYRQDIISITIPKCSRTYGVSPCRGAAGAGGECYNLREDCQDPANFDGSDTYTLRFYWAGPPDGTIGEASQPWVTSISHGPTKLQPGRIASREQLTVTLKTAPTQGVELDPYWKTRAYDRTQGDLLSILLARFPYLAGR
ncbi:MAG: hypothetical protein AAFX85_20065, partial [Pseudomonadota bacterium]